MPCGLKSLTLYENKQSLTNLPVSLETLEITNYNKVNDIKVPYGCIFKCTVNQNIIPNGITHLIFGEFFNEAIRKNDIPNSLTNLTFGDKFNQEIKENVLPNSIINLTFGKRFNQLLDNLPYSLKSLSLYENKQPLINLPTSLETLEITNYNKANDIKLPYGCILKNLGK